MEGTGHGADDVTLDASVGAGSGREPRAGRDLKVASGDTVGRYVVLAEVGAGGMGVVYAAYDPELDRKVALKILHPSPAGDDDAEGRRRLQREAQAMAQLNHPHVITVHDVGEHDGHVFMAMEFVDGGTLGAVLARRGASWREAVELFVQAGRGLAAAHAVGLVHRDFKPDNVLVGADGRARVLDFGLARPPRGQDEAGPDLVDASMTSERHLDARLTRTGALLGTPAYMAPEQYMHEAVDARSDQFSFCVALWEALYGQRPFAGETVAALALSVTSGKLCEPANDPGVPPHLRRALRKGLSTRAADRFASMDALVAALRSDPARNRRRWVRLSLAGAVGIGLALGGQQLLGSDAGGVCEDVDAVLSSVWGDTQHRAIARAFEATGASYAASTLETVISRTDWYARQWRAAYLDNCNAMDLGEQSSELFDLRMRCLSRRRDALGTLAVRLTEIDHGGLDEAILATASLPAVETCSDIANLRLVMPASRDPATEAEVRRLLDDGRIVLRLAKFAEARASAEHALELARQLEHQPLEAEAMILLGSVAEAMGDYPEAERLLTEAVWLAHEVGHDQEVARAAAELLTLVGVRLARPQEGRWWGQLGAAALARQGGRVPVMAARLAADSGSLLLELGERERAQEEFDRAIELFTEAGGPRHPAIGQIYNNAANAMFTNGDFAGALALYQDSLTALERAYGPDHPVVGATLHNLGNTQGQLGEVKQGLVTLERALHIRERGLGPDHPQTANTRGSIGTLMLRDGDMEGARQRLERALTTMRETLGPEHPTTAVMLVNLAEVHERIGDLDEAERMFADVRRVLDASLGPEHPMGAYADAGLGRVSLARGDAARAVPLLERALAHAVSDIGDPELAGNTRFALAQALDQTGGDRARVLELAQKARADFEAIKLPAKMAQVDAFVAARGGSVD